MTITFREIYKEVTKEDIVFILNEFLRINGVTNSEYNYISKDLRIIQNHCNIYYTRAFALLLILLSVECPCTYVLFQGEPPRIEMNSDKYPEIYNHIKRNISVSINVD